MKRDNRQYPVAVGFATSDASLEASAVIAIGRPTERHIHAPLRLLRRGARPRGKGGVL